MVYRESTPTKKSVRNAHLIQTMTFSRISFADKISTQGNINLIKMSQRCF